jgi:hypothetical protein
VSSFEVLVDALDEFLVGRTGQRFATAKGRGIGRRCRPTGVGYGSARSLPTKPSVDLSRSLPGNLNGRRADVACPDTDRVKPMNSNLDAMMAMERCPGE